MEPRTVQEAYDLQAIATPQAPAIHAPGYYELTYEGLVGRSHSLASGLAARLAQSRGCVALFVDRTHRDFLPLCLACARCYRPFVLLSTDLPDKQAEGERNRFLLETLRPSLIVTDTAERMATTPSDGMDWISLEDSLLDDTNSGQPLALVKTRSEESESGEDPSERIFCLMCTGGSRQLKIAKVSHVVVLTDVRYYPTVRNLRRRLEGGQPRVLQQLRNYWAGSSVGTLSLCLAFGGCAVVTTTADATELRRLVISERVDVVGMVPDQLRLLAEDPCKELPWVRLVMTWGERFPGSLVDRWRGHPGLVLELFAATEFWLGFVGQPVAEYTDRGGGGCLLRSAGSHVSYLVLDDAMMPVPEGDVGELFVCGPFVIPGYVDEATTEASFLSIHGHRYYRTRDRVLVAPGGIIYHSRADHRAKRGGQWVDLAVTEKALQGIVGIKEVCAVEDNSGLCAFLSLDASCLRVSSGLATAAKAIRRVRELLPSRSFLQLLPELPRNPTGKIHLQALEQRWEGQSRARQAKAAQPHLRRRLQAVCCQHALCGIAALVIAVGGDAVGAGLRQPLLQLRAQGASQLGTQWPLLRALGMAYSWLAMAQLSHSSVRLNAFLNSLPMTRMGFILTVHLLPAHWLRLLLASIGAAVAARRRRLAAWPLVFWLGVGTQLHYEVCQASARVWAAVLRLLGDGAEEAHSCLEMVAFENASAAASPVRTKFSNETAEVVFSESDSDRALQTFRIRPDGPDGPEGPDGAAERGERRNTATLSPLEHRAFELLQQILPVVDVNDPLTLDSLRAGWLTGAFQSLRKAVDAAAVQQAASVSTLLSLVKAAPALPASAPEPKTAEYILFIKPNHFSQPLLWLARTEGAIDAATLRGAVKELVCRHPGLRARNADPIALRNFVRNCASLLMMVMSKSTRLSSLLGGALLRCWPRMVVAPADGTDGQVGRFQVFQVQGQDDLEHRVQSGWQFHTWQREPLEIWLLQLSVALEGTWDCDGGQVRVARNEDGELIYVDPAHLKGQVVLRTPEHPLSPAPPTSFRPLYSGHLDGASVWLRISSPGNMQVCLQRTPESEMHTFAVTRLPQPGDPVHKVNFVLFLCLHTVADGYSFSAFAADLFDIYEALAKKTLEMPPAKNDELSILESRVKEALFQSDDPMRHSLRGNLWGITCRGYTCGLVIQGRTLLVLKAVAQSYAVPMNHLLLTLVSVAKARASACSEVDLTMYVPMRDGLEAGMAGLFADWRDICVPTALADSTILGVLLHVTDILRMRRWTIYDARRKPEQILVNFDSIDDRRYGAGIRQVPEAMWTQPWFDFSSKWLSVPLQFDMWEEHQDRWCMAARMSYKMYPPCWCSRFLQAFQDATWDVVFQPLEPVHKPFAE